MRRLPDDFNVNILLPGAVWLLISVLAGRVAVARLETDAITIVMFVVISLVIFIVRWLSIWSIARKSSNCRSANLKRLLHRPAAVPLASLNRPQNQRQHVGFPFHRISRMP